MHIHDAIAQLECNNSAIALYLVQSVLLIYQLEKAHRDAVCDLEVVEAWRQELQLWKQKIRSARNVHIES